VKSGSISEQIMIKCKNAIKSEKWVMPSDKSYDTDKKLLNSMYKCCVCVCVCVWESGNNIVLFFGCANKIINPLYFYYFYPGRNMQ